MDDLVKLLTPAQATNKPPKEKKCLGRDEPLINRPAKTIYCRPCAKEIKRIRARDAGIKYRAEQAARRAQIA